MSVIPDSLSEPNTKVQFSFELWKRKETFYAQAKWFLCFFAQIAKRSCQLHFYLGVIFIKYALEYNFLSAKHLQYKKNSYLCTQITGAPVVQWIELRFPKPSIRVRFPAGVLPHVGSLIVPLPPYIHPCFQKRPSQSPIHLNPLCQPMPSC